MIGNGTRDSRNAPDAGSARHRGIRPRRRALAALLAGALFIAGAPAWGQLTINLRFGGRGKDRKAEASALAVALAGAVGQVEQRFDAGRRALRPTTGPGGEPAYPRAQVVSLIDTTERDLGEAIAGAGGAELAPLHAWAAEKLQHARSGLDSSPGPRIAALAGAPRAVAVVASLGAQPLPETALAESTPRPKGAPWPEGAPPREETLGAEQSNRILDQIGDVIGRLFLLAKNDDLTVTLWVGSTPRKGAKFAFWPEGYGKGSKPAATILDTDGKREHVVRGLYNYRASLAAGQLVEYLSHDSSGPAHAGLGDDSERLDLVNDSSFFCCRFDRKYCHHVDSAKSCRPDRR